MAASGGPARQPRRGPAPIASFDHDVSDESSPETKQSFRLPEIREDPAAGGSLAVSPGGAGEQRARSHSTPAATALVAPPAPRIDISRASSSSHHDSRDSSPELALFAGGGGEDARARLELGFREDGALDLRSSTEELAFLEPAPGEPPAAPPPARPSSAAPPPPPPPSSERRHSRKDSQSSEAALLAVSGRTSRLSSVGSQCSAQSALSALSRVSRLSVVSGTSRSPSPHRMLLETSFCGPKPIETDPEISSGALVEQMLGIAKMTEVEVVPSPPKSPSSSDAAAPAAAPVDARDRREVRTEVTVESARPAPVAPVAPIAPAAVPLAVTAAIPPPTPAQETAAANSLDGQKCEKENTNRSRTEERKARPRMRREPSEPEVYKSRNKSKDIIRIKLKPDDSYEEEEESSRPSVGASTSEGARKPATLELGQAARPAEPSPGSPSLSRRRSPSPAGPPVSRKSSFCSLFKSRETIASPESPSEALRRKRSLTEGRSRSKSRDRSATPTSTCKIRGSVLSLFRTSRRSGASPSPGSREGSPIVQPARSLTTTPAPSIPPTDRRRADKLKYYDDTKDGIIHIPLRTPPEETAGSSTVRRNSGSEAVATAVEVTSQREPRPASAPQPRALPDRTQAESQPNRALKMEQQPRAQPPARAQQEPLSRIKKELSHRSPSSQVPKKPIHRTVLPDGSIIIPLHSPTERSPETDFSEPARDSVRITVAAERDEPIAAPDRIENSVSPTTAGSTPGGTTTSTPPDGDADAKLAASTPDILARAEPAPSEDTRRRRKERLIFTTHVGSREQVFSTQFSITKTPSVTSEISGSFPSFTEGEEPRPPPLRDTRIAADEPPAPTRPDAGSGAGTPQDAPRDSSESEPSSEAAPARTGNDVERRGLVVQESFEEELPYVPTTLPQERSVALPMVPVRERGGVRVSGVRRPRAAAPPPAPPAAPPAAPLPQPADKLLIRLPRRPRPTSAASAPEPDRPGTRSGGDGGSESRSKREWIDFEDVPERRKQPKRIQTLPTGAAGGVVFSYVEPEHCRCECHARADDQLPLLPDDMQASRISSSSAECGDEESNSQLEVSVHIARPFTADLDIQPDRLLNTEPARQ